MSGWVAVDVETTGLVPGVHAVWEAAVVTDDGQEFSWLVEDVNLRTADARALEVGRFFERWDCAAATKEPALIVARKLSKLAAGKHLVGINPAFDARFIGKMLKLANRPVGWHYHLIDVAPMALGWLHGRVSGCTPDGRAKHIGSAGTLPWRSDDLSRACGVEPPAGDERHTALGDARWAARWYRHLTGQVS